MSILKLLHQSQVLAVEKIDDSQGGVSFIFGEACDYYYDVKLSSQQVRELANELLNLVADSLAERETPQ